MRFYEPIAGKILIDGREIEQYQLASLRKATGVISRDAFLFDDSLANNIAYGLNNVSQTDIIDAARQARLDSSQLPEGLATQIGASGTMSEIQRLKVSFARAWLRNPQILVINEPIKELDREPIISEITEIIANLSGDRTTLIVTQQPNLALKADYIIVLERGRIVERGTHQQLLRSGSIYPRLCSMRFKTSQQSRQVKLAQKIARKLARQTNNSVSSEIRHNLNVLLDKLQLIDKGLPADEREQNRILDESYQSAKNMLIDLKEYQQKISRRFDEIDS